jgi:hypothetical protein
MKKAKYWEAECRGYAAEWLNVVFAGQCYYKVLIKSEGLILTGRFDGIIKSSAWNVCGLT